MATMFLTALLLAVGAAEKPTLETLETKEVQTLVDTYLHDPTKKAVWKRYTDRLILEAARLEYRKVGWDGKEAKAYVIIWVVPVRADVKLSAAEEATLRDELREDLDNVVRQGMLLKKRAVELQYAIWLDGKVDPKYPQYKPKQAENGPGQKKPTPPLIPGRRQYVWRFVPGPCWSCTPGWYVRVLVESPSEGEEQQSVAVGRERSQVVQARPRRQVPVAAKPPVRRNSPPQTVQVRPRSPVLTFPRQTAFVSRNADEPRPERRRTEMDVPSRKPAAAAALFWQGYGLYWKQDYAEALARFKAATRGADDARYWYFRAMAERALGKTTQARQSLERAVRLQREGKPGGESVGLALERVQGSLRRWIRDAQDSAGEDSLALTRK